MTKEANLYGSKVVQIPAPRFVIFYNGEEKQPEQKILKLSDMYFQYEENPALELEAVMLNINQGCNQRLMESCKSLREYSEYTARVRKYAGIMELDDAVERAITECIREGILSDFLSKNRAEAKKVSIYEYDAEKHIRMERAEAKEEGRRKRRGADRADQKEAGKRQGSASDRGRTGRRGSSCEQPDRKNQENVLNC